MDVSDVQGSFCSSLDVYETGLVVSSNRVASFLITFILILLSLSISPDLNAQQEVDGQALTFESFITNPPNIKDAVWEEDMPSQILPPQLTNALKIQNSVIAAKSSFFRLKYDGHDYFLEHIAEPQSIVGLGGSGGQFGDVQWGARPGERGTNCWVVSWNTNSTPVDYSVPRKTGSSSPPFSMLNQELQARYEARRFLCMGMFEMIPGTAIWSKSTKQFTATYDEPTALDATTHIPLHGQMTVKLSYQNNLPVKAEVELDCGIQYVVAYKYSQDFAAGQLPAEFTRYFEPLQGEAGKAYAIHIIKLQTTTLPFSAADFDFHKLLNQRYIPVKLWTNGEVYRETAAGIAKVPTKEELAAGAGGRYGIKPRMVRAVFFGFMVVLTTVVIVFVSKIYFKLQKQK